MVYLSSAVVLVGLVALLNLLLSVGVIRRLRQHTDHLNGLLAGAGGPAPLPAGTVVADFAATTTEGEPVSRDLLSEWTLVGFFSPGCQACEPQLPGFVELADQLGRHRTLAVVATLADAHAQQEEQEYQSRLGSAARVIHEAGTGPLQQAFRVTGFPSFFLIDADAKVAASGYGVSEVSVAVAAGQVAV